MDNTPLSLFELNNSIKNTLHSEFDNTCWVVAEISDIRENRNGHCYLELIEKDKDTEQIIAKIRANIWAYTYRVLKPYFESVTKQTLVAGIKVMVNVNVTFQEVFGISLNVRDIDPNYTLGDMAQKRQAILNQLREEGVINMNKETELPPVVQKIAIISSPTAAGYEDFIKQLEHNNAGIKFYTKLFPAIMQGEQTESSVIAALDRIYQYESFFDIAVIIRGGGSSSDLMAFDNYWIAYNIAQFPIPVFSGIGHERDESIVDLVAHTPLKTPTAVAEYIVKLASDFNDSLTAYKHVLLSNTKHIIDKNKNQYINNVNRLRPLVRTNILHKHNKLNEYSYKLFSDSRYFIDKNKIELSHKHQDITHAVHSYISKNKVQLEQIPVNINAKVNAYIEQQKLRLSTLHKSKELLDPKNILKKGYSLTYANDGRIIKNKEDVNTGDVLTTYLYDTSIKSIVQE